jgi:ligand-binding sensor domain-containing protein
MELGFGSLRVSGLDRLDPATGAYTHFRFNMNDPGSLINDTVSVILQDKDGEIWIGTYGGLKKFEPKTKQFVHYRNMQMMIHLLAVTM